jgi:DNA-binding transcriptional MerR regulator
MNREPSHADHSLNSTPSPGVHHKASEPEQGQEPQQPHHNRPIGIGRLAKPPLRGTLVFTIFAICLAFLLLVIGWRLYDMGEKKGTEYYALLGELIMQLAVLAVAGALFNFLFHWGTSQSARYFEKLAERKEFLRRVRTMHVTIQNARDLLNADSSAKTWNEQSRRLMELRAEVQEICDDLQESGRLFEQQIAIVDDLKAIIKYLKKGDEEYVRCYVAVDEGDKAASSLSNTIEHEKMTWVRDFMDKGDEYTKRYEKHLKASKGAMRREIYSDL